MGLPLYTLAEQFQARGSNIHLLNDFPNVRICAQDSLYGVSRAEYTYHPARGKFSKFRAKLVGCSVLFWRPASWRSWPNALQLTGCIESRVVCLRGMIPSRLSPALRFAAPEHYRLSRPRASASALF